MSYLQPENKLKMKIDATDERKGWVDEKEIPVQLGEHIGDVIDRLIAFRNAGIAVFAVHNGKRYSSQDHRTIQELVEVCSKHSGEVKEFLAQNQITNNKKTKLSGLEKWERQYYRETIDNLYSAETPKDKQTACDTMNEFSQVYGDIEIDTRK